MIVIVDYHKGNLRSVERGLEAIGARVEISDDPAVIAQAQGIVLPGVGSFADAALTMRELGQSQVIRDRAEQGIPFLGICLGMHLMFETGIEHSDLDNDTTPEQGMGLLPGEVGRIPAQDAKGVTHKVPHVGWNSLNFEINNDCRLLEGIEPGEYFYYTHSFIAPSGSFVKASTTHALSFPGVVQYGNVAFGVQFHPEKSSDAGLLMLKNFAALTQ